MVTAALEMCLVFLVVQTLDPFIIGWQCLNRPIVIAPIAGLVLGDFRTGIIMGAGLESIFMGISAIGGSIPADPTSASLIAVAYAVLTGATTDSGLALALPIGTVMASISMIVMSLLSNPLAPYWERVAVKGKNNQLAIQSIIFSILMNLASAVVLFLAIAYGVAGLNSFLASLPSWVMTGLGAASGMMLAVGFAILTSMIWSGEVGAFFFLGYVLVKYANLSVIPIAVIGIVIAITIFILDKDRIDLKNSLAKRSKAATESGEEEFFK
ncbi:MAG: PTS sugar transporter subunit IIC [Anaerolineaceae bacterium]|jgi:PTS system mannose-specific IIC component/fructoselysine and glucoselysine-specific PTS system IIC component